MAKNKIFSSLIDNKRESSGLIMTSVLVAVGVNMLSTGIVDLLGLRFGFQIKEVILITIGIFFVSWSFSMERMDKLQKT